MSTSVLVWVAAAAVAVAEVSLATREPMRRALSTAH